MYDVYGGSQGFYHFQKLDNGSFRASAVLDTYNSINEFYQAIGAVDLNNNPFISQFGNENNCLLYKIEPNSGNSFNLPSSNSITSNTEFWFDVFVKIEDGEYKLNKSEIILEYSTEWFYPNMVADEYILYNQGEYNMPEYSLTITDVDTNIIRLTTDANTENYGSLETVNQQWKLLASIGVILKNVSNENPIEQQLDLNYSIENNYRTNDGYIEDFECVRLKNGATCGMEITSLTETAAAGVGLVSENGIPGVVEIIGDNFLGDEPFIGSCIKPDEHHVKFRTIDNDWIAPLEGDYLEYTNTRIVVKVPTVGYKNNSQEMYAIPGDLNDAVACTGEVRVCRRGLALACGCQTTSDTDVYIPFAVRNSFQTNSIGCKESVRTLLRNLNENGGYTIRFLPNFKALVGAVDAFKRATTTWRCATRVNFEIDEIGNPTTTPGNCIVRMRSLGAGVRGATFYEVENCGIEPNVEFSSSNESFAISFNDAINWHTDTSMPSLNWNDPYAGQLEGDMESTALHEIGHAHLLLHTCNDANVMFRPGPGGSSTNEYRRLLPDDDENGGVHVSMLSSSQTASSCDGLSMLLINIANCNITSIVEINGIRYEFLVFPNPTSSFLNIKLVDNLRTLSGVLSIYNSQGSLVKHDHLYGRESIIDTKLLPPGLYYIQFTSESNNSFLISKFLKN